MRYQLSSVLGLAPMLLAVSCGGVEEMSELESGTSQELKMLEQDYGGFDTTDEAPMFGEADAYRRYGLLSEETPIEEPPVDAARQRAEGVAEHLTVSIFWGDRVPDRDGTLRTRWTGIIGSRAADIRRVSAHGLESGDRLAHGRLDAILLDTTTTEGDLDGVVFHLVIPRDDPSGALIIDTNQLKLRIPLSDLASFRHAYRTQSGDLVGISAFRLRHRNRPEPSACLRAHVRGHWGAAGPDGLAHFRGLVFTREGRIAHIFGRAADGKLGGKIVDAGSGAFIALVHGVYGGEQFRARVRSREAHGTLLGMYGHREARRAGWFGGRLVLCPDGVEDELEPVEPTDLPEAPPLPEDGADPAHREL